MVMDALSQAAHNTAILLNMNLDVPPVKRSTERLQGDETYMGNSQEQMSIDSTPVSIVDVYEIWQVLLDESEFEIDKAFVVISAKYKKQGYEGGKWSDVSYEGFYTTLQEAENEIEGYLFES